MKIAIVGTVHKPIQKNTTGGTEYFTYTLVEELVRLGHHVTLFATSDSQTSAQLVSVCSSEETDERLVLMTYFVAQQLALIQKVIEMSGQFDVIHDSLFETFLSTPLLQLAKKPIIHTIHHDLFHSEMWSTFFSRLQIQNSEHFVFVSNNQHKAAGSLLPSSVIYNGIDTTMFPFHEKPGDYVLWFGRISPKKGPKEAIIAAQKAGVKLLLAGVIDKPINQQYFDQELKPLFTPNVTPIIEPLPHEKKVSLYQNAKALLVPISWEEPFGLTMIEAMACGTPVIAYSRGAAPEIVIDGKTGYIVKPDDSEEFAKKINEISHINRIECRHQVEEKFTQTRMVEQYVQVYNKLYENSTGRTNLA